MCKNGMHQNYIMNINFLLNIHLINRSTPEYFDNKDIDSIVMIVHLV
jgi:hypothetical protein